MHISMRGSNTNYQTLSYILNNSLYNILAHILKDCFVIRGIWWLIDVIKALLISRSRKSTSKLRMNTSFGEKKTERKNKPI